MNGEKICDATSGVSVQQINGGVVYANGQKVDDIEVIHIGRRKVDDPKLCEATRPCISALKLSSTAKLLIDSKEIEDVVEFDVFRQRIRLSLKDGTSALHTDVKRLEILGKNPFEVARPDVLLVGNVSISCASVRVLTCDQLRAFRHCV